MYVNTSTGLLLVDESSVVRDNHADGIKYNFHHREPDRSASDTFQDFCAGASNPSQAYPIVTVATQNRYSFNDLACVRVSFSWLIKVDLLLYAQEQTGIYIGITDNSYQIQLFYASRQMENLLYPVGK